MKFKRIDDCKKERQATTRLTPRLLISQTMHNLSYAGIVFTSDFIHNCKMHSFESVRSVSFV